MPSRPDEPPHHRPPASALSQPRSARKTDWAFPHGGARGGAGAVTPASVIAAVRHWICHSRDHIVWCGLEVREWDLSVTDAPRERRRRVEHGRQQGQDEEDGQGCGERTVLRLVQTPRDDDLQQ